MDKAAVEEIKRHFGAVAEGLGSEMQILAEGQGHRFDVLERRFDLMERRFDVMEQKVDGIERRLQGNRPKSRWHRTGGAADLLRSDGTSERSRSEAGQAGAPAVVAPRDAGAAGDQRPSPRRTMRTMPRMKRSVMLPNGWSVVR
jgi:hypothetical protein